MALFLAANYALYLRVSGWFHLITGLLHLFGFDLPRTHQNYFLASSVSDIWRRINIYWKDFMTKVFFFPVVFALERWSTRGAMAVATLVVFVATWLLHSYQVFWINGELPLNAGVAGLWLAAGVLVALSLQFELAGARLQESGGRSRETGDRSQESGDRSQETGDRRGVRSQETGVRRQETGVRNQRSGCFIL